MQINQSVQLNTFKSPSFKGQRLYALNLLDLTKKGSDRFVPAYFTQIDETDVPFLKQIQPLWEKTQLGKQILTGIFNKIEEANCKNKFFMIECPQFENIFERLRALASVYLPNKIFANLDLQLLQSSSQLEINKLKGSGTAILRGLCKYAKSKEGINSIDVISKHNAAEFYERQGLYKNEQALYPSFYLNRSDFDEYNRRTSNKYGKIRKVE